MRKCAHFRAALEQQLQEQLQVVAAEHGLALDSPCGITCVARWNAVK